MIYDRHEDLSATTKRHPAIIHHRSGVMRDGSLVAQDIDVVMDGGAYCTLTPVVLSRGTLHAGGPYACPNVRINGRAVATNTPPNGAFRGFGAPQTEFAAEMQVNRIADALGHRPLELRRRWVYREGDETPTGQILRESLAARRCWRRQPGASEFARHSAADRARARLVGRVRARAPGSGIALGWHGAGFTGSGEVQLASVACVELTDDGRIRVLTASTEMGQGTKTIFPQLVAEQLGVASRRRDGAAGHFASSPTAARPSHRGRRWSSVGWSSRPRDACASRSKRRPAGLCRTYRASRQARRGARRPAVRALSERRVRRRDVPRRRLPRLRLGVRRGRGRGRSRHRRGHGARLSSRADDIGKVIHPVLAEGQVEGGTLQAVGYATIEEIKLEDGRYLNDRLATYIIPTSLDAPRIEAILVEKPYSGAPHGAKGVGELPMDVGAPAVVAAIHDATGVWIHDLPATPERILAAMTAPAR